MSYRYIIEGTVNKLMIVGMLYGLVASCDTTSVIYSVSYQAGEGEGGRQTEKNIAVLLED